MEEKTVIRDEFFNELEAEKALLVSAARDFNQSPYFHEIDPAEEQILDQYLQKILGTIIATESSFQQKHQRLQGNNVQSCSLAPLFGCQVRAALSFRHATNTIQKVFYTADSALGRKGHSL